MSMAVRDYPLRSELMQLAEQSREVLRRAIPMSVAESVQHCIVHLEEAAHEWSADLDVATRRYFRGRQLLKLCRDQWATTTPRRI
jgi:hypothetical protein